MHPVKARCSTVDHGGDDNVLPARPGSHCGPVEFAEHECRLPLSLFTLPRLVDEFCCRHSAILRPLVDNTAP